ncbi:uncharacterized protein LOC110412080 [Herrania umbratica]|uniref:Uncharacterized protein LOC110412080 n=1 Tax=Herrania umbratica TaxID=108875 RepID=A0A6J0ZTV5_9ROSI|nr:uncharacterized protein LOC110412080 [Herrania umbratica]
MLPSSLLCSIRPNFSRKKKGNRDSLETEAKDLDFWYSVTFNRDPSPNQSSRVSLRSDNSHVPRNAAAVKAKKKGEMATKVSNFSDLIQRVAASCLLHPLAAGRQESGEVDAASYGVIEENPDEEEYYEYGNSSEDEEKENGGKDVEKSRRMTRVWNNGEKSKEMVALMEEVFESVAEMKKAYVRLQDAHCPWDPERMRAADVAVVGELRRLGVLRERFRRRTRGGGGGVGKGHVAMLKEVVAPYEAAVEELKREVKVKEVEIENLKGKLNTVTCLSNGGKKGRGLSKRKVSCSQVIAAAPAPAPELFEATMSQVKEASKSFTSVLLSLMREARWDIAAAVRSIEAATATPDTASFTTTITPSVVANHHSKYALESYVSRKTFQGFDHETFYMDGSLSSLLNPDQYRRECFTQYRDMKAMDPVELLGILPTCHFGKFCSKKYLAIVHPKMEESLFGDLEQRSQVLAGNHPRSQFYGEFLGLAKAVWLLHLLAFSLDPSPSQFEASRGAEFHPHYMESVVKISGGRVPTGQIVGFPVSPGFKLANGSVVKARVYLVART